MTVSTDRFVKQYGEEYRDLIEDAIAWLADHEVNWELATPYDQDAFIKDLMASVTPETDGDEE